MERRYITLQHHALSLPLVLSTPFRIIYQLCISIEFSARYTTNFPYARIIFYLFIIPLLFISVFWGCNEYNE